jgi:hypothetical protein
MNCQKIETKTGRIVIFGQRDAEAAPKFDVKSFPSMWFTQRGRHVGRMVKKLNRWWAQSNAHQTPQG